jgi:cytochrome c551/c552
MTWRKLFNYLTEMVLKKLNSLVVLVLAASIWIGCSSKEDKQAYDKYYGSGSKERVESSLKAIEEDKKNAPAIEENTAAAPAKPARKAVPADVAALLNTHTCFACHQPYDKIIGPAYADVAKKNYTVDQIVELVHNPKPEHWPGFPPMAPMPHVPKGDIITIATWINTL